MAVTVKVLLVDDNAMVLTLLRQAVGKEASVQLAMNPADALLKAIDDPPDLLVTDFQMPGMDGRQLVEKLWGRPATEHLPVVMLASHSDIAERLKPMQDSLADLIEKPFFLRDLASRLKRVIDRVSLEKMARAAGRQETLRGSLDQMSVLDLLQSLEMGRKTCGLTLARSGERCQLFFTEGQIVHATCGELAGDEAVYRVVPWSDPTGTFEIDFSTSSDQQTTTRSTQGLLMEGLRLLDEANRDAEFLEQ